MLVEINTLLLLLRRKVSYSKIIEIPFLLSWVLLRNIWYPLLMVYFMMCYAPALGAFLPGPFWKMRVALEGENAVTMKLVSMLSWTAVCIFQMKWTVQLFLSHPWFGKALKQAESDGDSKKPGAKGYL